MVYANGQNRTPKSNWRRQLFQLVFLSLLIWPLAWYWQVEMLVIASKAVAGTVLIYLGLPRVFDTKTPPGASPIMWNIGGLVIMLPGLALLLSLMN